MDTDKILSSCKKIVIYSENSLKQIETLQSSLDDIISKNELLILSPTLNSRLVKLSTNEVYDIIFFCESSPYQSKMKIKKYFVKDGIRLAHIVLQSSLSRIQRRESYRLDCNNVSIQFSIYDDTEEAQIPENGIIDDDALQFEHSGIVKNISSGGIKFNANEELEVDTILHLLIEIDDQTIITKGKILFVENIDFEKYKFSYKLCFVDLPLTDKKFLEKYIFDEQLRIIKKNNAIK